LNFAPAPDRLHRVHRPGSGSCHLAMQRTCQSRGDPVVHLVSAIIACVCGKIPARQSAASECNRLGP